MTPEAVRIVRSTWVKVGPLKYAAAHLFYDRLFESDPSLRVMFRSDIVEQGEKLMHVMEAAVNGLNRPERVVPLLEELGRRHAGYGVLEHHYGTVGEALLWTLAQCLGKEFTADVKDAWTEVYGFLATTMREAAEMALAQTATDPFFVGDA